MNNFTKRIAIKNAFKPEFFFHKIFTGTGLRYHVSVADEAGNSFSFDMELTLNGWKIIDAPKLPDWVIAIEKKLENAIVENKRAN